MFRSPSCSVWTESFQSHSCRTFDQEKLSESVSIGATENMWVPRGSRWVSRPWLLPGTKGPGVPRSLCFEDTALLQQRLSGGSLKGVERWRQPRSLRSTCPSLFKPRCCRWGARATSGAHSVSFLLFGDSYMRECGVCPTDAGSSLSTVGARPGLVPSPHSICGRAGVKDR